MPLIVDINEVKAALGIAAKDTSEDKKLSFFIEYASDIIEEYLGRRGKLWYAERTEYYLGTGTRKLILRVRPVFATPTVAVREDDGGYWGSGTDAFDTDTALTYGTDFALQLDEPGGTYSRSGILFRINDFWSRPTAREFGYLTPHSVPEGEGNIRVVYTGGWKKDLLPAAFRMAAVAVVARLRAILPLGWQVTSESYEERSVSYMTPQKEDLLSLVKPYLASHRNWKW